MSDNNEKAAKQVADLVANANAKIQAINEEAESPSQNSSPPPSPEVQAMASRLQWIINVANAHKIDCMPWRANPPTKEDEEWCEKVITAVRNKTARPDHPDPDIEHMLLNGHF